MISLYAENSKETVAILTHDGHINKKSQLRLPYVYSMGYYLEKEFGNTYYTLSIFGGKGNVASIRNDKEDFVISELESPIEGSIEKLGLETGKSIFFYPSKAFENDSINLYFRSIGNIYSPTRDFQYGCLPSRTDGIIFIEKIEAITERNAHINTFVMNRLVMQSNILKNMED